MATGADERDPATAPTQVARPGAGPPGGGGVEVTPDTVESSGMASTQEGELEVGHAASQRSYLPTEGFLPGDLIVGNFRIDRMIGAGGMGVVYLAADQRLRREVALKIHRGAHGVDRLQREAVAMARLQHPNVIAVHEVGRIGERLFVAMEYVDGGTLRQWLAGAEHDWPEVVALLVGAGRGLAAAHAAGLIHRDFKPDNVLIGRDGRPRVGDFGLARAPDSTSGVFATVPKGGEERAPTTTPVDSTAVAWDLESGERPTGFEQRLTVTGAVVGTPAYMAPEQYSGAALDARADQFAFCVVLYEALFGVRPFAGQTAIAIMESIQRGAIRPAPEGTKVPRWIRDAVVRGLAAEPEQRWPSMTALLAALSRDPRAARRRWITAGLAVAVVVAVLGATVLFGGRSRAPSCAGAGRAIDAVWNAGARDTLRAHFAASAAPDGAARAADIIALLDDYRGRWHAAAENVCESATVKRTWSPELRTRGESCLTERRRSFSAAVDVLSTTPPRFIDRALAIAASLDGARACADADHLLAQPLPRQTTPREDELSVELARAEALLAGKRGTEVVALLARIETEVMAMPALAPRFLLLRGSVETGFQKFTEGVRLLTDAYFAARAVGDDELSVEAAARLIWVLGGFQDRPTEAAQWVKHGLADVAQEPHTMAASNLYQAISALAEQRGDYVEAVEYARRTVALAVRARGDDSYAVATMRNTLGAALDASGDSAGAITEYQESLRVFEALFGPGSRDTLEAENNLSLAYQSLGRHDEAELHARRAAAIAERGVTPDPVLIADIRHTLAEILASAGKLAEAKQLCEQILPVYRERGDETRGGVAMVLTSLGVIAAREGDHAAAERYHREALDIYKKIAPDTRDVGISLFNLAEAARAQGRCDDTIALANQSLEVLGRANPDHLETSYPLVSLGECQLERGETVAAITALERAVELRAKGGIVGANMGRARLGLAGALDRAGREPGRVRELMQQARDDYAAAPNEATKVAEIDRWLAAHPAD